MLWDPSALGPAQHPETCPGRDSRGRNPPPWGQPQTGAASNPSRLGSNPSHLQRFLGKEEKSRWKRRLFFFPPQEPRFHGTQWGAACPRT